MLRAVGRKFLELEIRGSDSTDLEIALSLRSPRGRTRAKARSARGRATHRRKLREVKEIFEMGNESALALVTGALEQLPLLVLAHLLAPLLDHTTHG